MLPVGFMERSAVSTVDRVVAILRILADGGSPGVPITDVAAKTGLSKATTHRLLAALCGVGYAYQDVSNRHYCLGVAARMLGFTALEHHVGALARGSLERLSSETGDTVFCSIAEGTAALCVDRSVGSFPIRTLTLDVGDRRPLGVGAGSLALLASMPDELVNTIVQRNNSWLLDFQGFTAANIASLVERTRADGYALNEGRIVSGMSGVAVAVLGSAGSPSPAGALSIAAIDKRMSPSRRDELVALLRTEAATLERSIAFSLETPTSTTA
jgi:DNA-binding IclR family transcriptional regulator